MGFLVSMEELRSREHRLRWRLVFSIDATVDSHPSLLSFISIPSVRQSFAEKLVRVFFGLGMVHLSPRKYRIHGA